MGHHAPFAALASLALFCGCASVSPDKSFREVQALAAERGIAHVRWNQDSRADAEAAQAVHELLEHELTADVAVQIALLGNQRLQATFEELGIAQADLVQAGLLRNPVFYGEVRFPPHPRVSPLELDVVQNFMDLFLLPLRKRLAEAQLESVKAQVAGAVLELAAKTRVDFYALQAALQMLQLQTTIVEAQSASADAAQRVHDAGNTTDLDLANEKALLAQAQIELVMAEEHMLDAREELTTTLGLPSGDFSLEPGLPEIPAQEPDAADLEAFALSRRLDLSAARADLEAFARAAGFARYQALNEVNLGLHLEREPEGTTTIGPSLELSLPIFDRGVAARARALAMLRQSERRYDALVIQARSEVRRERNHVLSARKRAEHFRVTLLPLREQIVQDTLLRYNGMLVGVFQLLQAKQEAIEAGKDYVEALQEYWTARTELELTVGGRMPEGTQADEPGGAAPAEPKPVEDAHKEHQHGEKP
ncbi:MAG: TolC family protein [Planctomycetota bacterium]